MEEKKDEDIVERLAKEFLKGMEEEEKRGKEAPLSEHRIEEEKQPETPIFEPQEEPSFKIPEPLPTFEPEEKPLPTFKTPEPEEPSFEIPEEKFIEPAFEPKEEPSFPTFEVPEPVIPEETFPSQRPSDEKIEEMLATLEEEEKKISLAKESKKIEEEGEEEEFVELPEVEEEEILVKKPKKRKVRGRAIKFVILGCILGGIIGGGFYLGKNYAKPIINLINLNVVNKVFKPSCDLVVSSNPDSCDVFVDDIVKGKTPITIKKLISGNHNIRIEKEGFKPYISVVSVVSRKPINVIANLEPEIKIQAEAEKVIPVGTATLIVKTNPKDSRVYIGGKLVKMPYLLLSGTYSIVVKRDGFFSSAKIIEIREGETKEVFVKLKASLGSIFIDSIPRVADVVFDGSFKGRTPLVLSGISPWRPYRITIRKKGYFDWNGTTFVEPAQRTKIMAFMKKKGEEPSYEKGEREIKEKPMLVEKKPFYKTEEKKPFYKTEETSPAVLELIRAIDRFKEDVKVATPVVPSFPEEPYLKREFPEIPKEKPKPQITGEPGTCFITSVPPGAEIFLNGRFIGKTPIRDFIIPEGRHRLKACLVGFKEQEKEIIVNGETSNFFNFSLKN